MKWISPRRALAALPLILLYAAAAPAQEAPLNLTLQDAVRQVVAKNLDVQVELYNPAVAEAQLRRNLAIYDPVLSLAGAYDRSNTPTSSTIFIGVPRQDAVRLDLGIERLLGTGGTAGVTLENSWNKVSGVSRALLTDYFQSSLLFTLNQPLLKNFGRETTELSINVARFNKEGSLERFRTRVADTVAEVRNDYFTLYSLREDLEVRRTSLALSQRILEETRARVRAGVLPAMEILSAQFNVATREKEVIDAERALKDQMDRLRHTLQLSEEGEIVPSDPPREAEYLVAEEEALSRALANRPELLTQRVNIRVSDLEERVARNRTRPDLNLRASAGLAGLDEKLSRELGDLAGAQHPAWGVGLQLAYPLGNRAARNDYARSRLLAQQSRAELKNQESSVQNEVRAAIRAVRATYKQLEVSDRGRDFAEERLRSFMKKNEVGLATTKEVFDVENDLVSAKANQIRARVEYNNAITALWRSTGEILEQQGIRLSSEDADALYHKVR